MTSKRKVIFDAAMVLIASAAMAGILFVAWDSVYGAAVTAEEDLLDAVPWMDRNGIQAVALFGLGLHLTWAGLFAQDARVRLQGTFIFVGSILAIVVLAFFEVGLPNMEPTLLNAGAFLLGFVVAICTELVEWRGNDYRGDLLDVDRTESSWWGHFVTRDGEEAQFHAARRGVLGFLILIVVGANLALATDWQETTTSLVVSLFVVTPFLVWRLYALLSHDFGNLDAEIIGPKGSGKTLFFYGMYSTLKSSDVFERSESDFDKMAGRIYRNQLGGDGWGVRSTNTVTTYHIDFIYDKWYWQEGTLNFTDFPGQLLNELFNRDSSAPRSDGGQSLDEGQPEDGGGGSTGSETDSYSEPEANGSRVTGENQDLYELGVPTTYANQLVNEGTERPREVMNMPPGKVAEIIPEDVVPDEKDSHEVAMEIQNTISENIPESDSRDVDRSNEPSDDTATESTEESGPEASDDIDEIREIEARLMQANQIICIIDTHAALAGNLIDDEDTKGDETYIEEEVEIDAPKLPRMSDICSHEEINAEKVILVATKADLLIPQYVKSDPNRRVPHDDQLGDFEDFTEWVRAKFDTDVFPEFGGKATDIYPVYHQTREEDGELEPNLEDNEVHAEGFEQVLKEIVLK